MIPQNQREVSVLRLRVIGEGGFLRVAGEEKGKKCREEEDNREDEGRRVGNSWSVS